MPAQVDNPHASFVGLLRIGTTSQDLFYQLRGSRPGFTSPFDETGGIPFSLSPVLRGHMLLECGIAPADIGPGMGCYPLTFAESFDSGSSQTYVQFLMKKLKDKLNKY